MPQDASLAIHWFRRDLRVADNTALHEAHSAHRQVVPVYALTSWKTDHSWTGPNRQQFLCGCLESLDKNLRTLDSRLIVRTGPALEVLERLVRETGAAAIFFNRDPDPFGRQIERELEKRCAAWGIACRGFDDVALHAPGEVLTKSGDPYRVYTPYSNNWLSLEKPKPLPKPGPLGTPPDLKSEPLPTLDHWQLPAAAEGVLPAGERAARDRLKLALGEKIATYGERRDIPSIDGTSRLSQDLRYGLLSPRTVFQQVNEAKANAPTKAAESIHTFIKELAWREFYFAILHHYPNVLDEEFNPDWRGLPWDEPGDAFEAWKAGRTGFPIVDAGMRQLRATGFMHNRVRMITAMFLTKDLHLDWRLGESYFMQQLVDGEIASNNGGWQWSAGTGADAAPYFRIQNPWSQSARHDPAGTYVRRWIPELEKVPAERLHAPPKDGRPLAPDYPLPILDHTTERNRTLALFKKHKAR